ncbi:MAG: TrmH family RNA methyltransferase [Planctomycetota bacterium]|nr:MAG: TrmH family RNA methyltransferase [Planctomycetota bacterium]
MTRPPQDPEQAPRRLRRAEAVLSRRSERILLVLERCVDSLNHVAVLRTAELFGIQDVWTVAPEPGWRAPNRKITRGSWLWLSNRHFFTPEACIDALRDEGRTIWATDLNEGAMALDSGPLQVPEKLALVIGRESDGVSPMMLQAADQRVFLPMHGFTSSFNLSVAAGLLLQRLFDACPEARGDMRESRKAELRAEWYRKLAKNESQRKAFEAWLDHPPPPFDSVEPPPLSRAPRVSKKIRERNRTLEETARRREQDLNARRGLTP